MQGLRVTAEYHASWEESLPWKTTVHEFRTVANGLTYRYLWTIIYREGMAPLHKVRRAHLDEDMTVEGNILGPLETSLLVREFELILSGGAK